MRIILLSCNTGEGHNSTAKAIQNVLSERGVESEIVDVLACLSPNFSKFICSVHAQLYKRAPVLWDVGYRAAETKELRSEEIAMLRELMAMGAKKLKVILDRGDYDAAICVHVFSGMMMTELRQKSGVTMPSFFVATDYARYPYTELCDMDGYFIPTAAQSGEFMEVGVPKDRLIPSGIPVRQEFYERGDTAAARETLGLPKQGIIALLMCGSMGCGPMKKIATALAERLPEDASLVAVCGKNKKLFDTLSEIDNPRLRVVGYTDRIPAYMDAADFIVTKPGGLSSTEAANKRLPMVFINAVGGCESRNFNFFLNRGYAVGSKKADNVIEQAVELANMPQRLRKMSQLLESNFTCNSAKFIADMVMDAAQQYRSGEAFDMAHGIETANNGNPLGTEGGNIMDQMNAQTILNLARSFAGESQARTRYTVYAQVARKEGYEQIARVFEETADNEAVHAEEFLEMMQKLGGCSDNIEIQAGYPFQLGNTLENLTAASDGELHEHDHAYPEFAEMARREGCDDAARLWMQIARIEGVHHNTFRQLKDQLYAGKLTKKDKPVLWRCLNCGYTYEGPNACDPCPVCHKSANWQEGDVDRKLLMEKK